MQKDQTEATIHKLVEPVAESFGLELILTQYRREQNGWVVRLFIDREGGVSVDECAEVSREVSDILDVEDCISTSYRLEVSSPGLDRPLTKPRHFELYSGQEVLVRTREPIEGRRNFKGILDGLEDERIRVTVDGRSFGIPWANLETANLVPNLEE